MGRMVCQALDKRHDRRSEAGDMNASMSIPGRPRQAGQSANRDAATPSRQLPTRTVEPQFHPREQVRGGPVTPLLSRPVQPGGAPPGDGPAQTGPSAVPAQLVLDVLRGSGQPLPARLRQEMEGRFGADFSDVRIHADSAARASAAAVDARAYTVGNHIVTDDGSLDRHTLAHELSHVIQQRSGAVAGAETGAAFRLSDPSDRFERDAESDACRPMASAAPARRETRGLAGGEQPQRTTGNQAASASLLTRPINPGGSRTTPAVVQRKNGKKKKGSDYYAYGSANKTPHVHVYKGGAHLQIADPARGGKTKRYNLVANGGRHSQAATALGAAAGNAELTAAINGVFDKFGV
jgi:Domain of unknown function (DUF4157)